ncbi:MAG: pilus assembly protein [Candidatus Melainabacteria bacterium]|nr:pilus assembly protein [Candidatus Melainabacteria bacterium]
MKLIYQNRTPQGVSIAEAAASLGLLLPLVILVVFVILEASYAYLIKTSLSQAARQAARDLAIAYGQNSQVATSRALQDSMVFSNIQISKMVTSTQQFDNPVFNAAADPPTVSVTVRYLSGQYGLPVFPNPDPLNLGSSFIITASSTYRLE